MSASERDLIPINETGFKQIDRAILSAIAPITRSKEFYRSLPPPQSIADQFDLLLRADRDEFSKTIVITEQLIRPHDYLTYHHSVDVGMMSWAMGGLLGLDQLRCLQLGLLHDEGKLAVPDNILADRWLEQFLQTPQDTQRVETRHKMLRMHGITGGIMLRYLGYDSLYQRVAREHGREILHFHEDDPIELIVVVVADWFSSIKDPQRNAERRTNWNSQANAIAQMQEELKKSGADCPPDVVSAFQQMIAYDFYPKNHTDHYEQGDPLKTLYQQLVYRYEGNSVPISLPDFFSRDDR